MNEDEIGDLADVGPFNAAAVAETLFGAAYVISQYGLHKGSFWRGFNSRKTKSFAPFSMAWDWPHRAPCCLVGAIKVSAAAYVDNVNRAQWSIRAMVPMMPQGFSHLAAWNDFPETDGKEIEAALRECAGLVKTGEIRGSDI